MLLNGTFVKPTLWMVLICPETHASISSTTVKAKSIVPRLTAERINC